MSKKTPSKQKNTIFNYFQSPNTAKDPPKAPVQTTEKPNKQTILSDESDEDVVPVPKKRFRRIMSDNSDSGSENESPNIQEKKPIESEKKTKKRKLNPEESSGTPKKSLKEQFSFEKPAPNASSSNTKQPIALQAPKDIHSNWLHNSLQFLQPENIRDAMKRKQNDPNYDCTTLYVPQDFLNQQTPAMRQWWELKSQHYDSVIFFKVGKFYELYHMDAVVGVTQLGFSYMKGEFAHSGFPEQAYGKMVSTLVAKGFKVARTEQTETPEMMTERCKNMKKATKFDRVVNREICQITTKATCVYNAQLPDSNNSFPCFLYAVAEKVGGNGLSRFGVTFVDTSTGAVRLSEFEDDKYCSKLLALFAENSPGLILAEKGRFSPVLKQIINVYFKDVRKEFLLPQKQFLSASDTLQQMSNETYFRNKDGHFQWPNIFSKLADDCVPKENYELCLKSLGACMWYLKDSKIDVHVLSLGKIDWYEPLDVCQKIVKRDYMVLDAKTMTKLDLLGGRGTLQKTLDYCCTSFGKRLLLQWICRPLCDVDKIKGRQEAVHELFETPEMLANCQNLLKTLPDLERQVAKLHAYGNKFCTQDHPDGRAILYEGKTYSKRKILDFLKTLRGFEKIQNIPEIFKDCKSRLLRKITQYSPVGLNVDLSEILEFFRTAFDQKKAEKEGVINPKEGVDEEYDNVLEKIRDINSELDEYLKEQTKFFGCKVTYSGTDKKRFQLEIPENKCHKLTDEYQLEGTKKGARKYSTPKTREFLIRMIKAETERDKIIQDLNRRIFEKFCQNKEQLQICITNATILDVLCSLAEYGKQQENITMPELRDFDTNNEIIIRDGIHPNIVNLVNFVPNDTQLGGNEHPAVLLLTGPNMGGKTTLMRQVALISIMAQMGSFVPATYCKMNLVDRIFTRIGAYDDMTRGHSTFFVELSEAASILEHATNRSLIILDELGRGTSTYDGTAVAHAYIEKLIQLKSRTFFSTHYHSLVDEYMGNKNIQLGHMACVVENESDPLKEKVTFLYKMTEGFSQKSFGFNVANLAGLNRSIVMRGREIAKVLEEEVQSRTAFTKVFTSSDIQEIRAAIKSL